MRRLPMFLIAAVLVATGGCDRQPVEPVPEPEIASPILNFNNNPYGGSEHIYRSQNYAFFLVWDAESPLVAVLSSTPDCGGFLEPADIQRVVQDPYDVIHSQVHELTLADPINLFIVDTSVPGGCFGYDLIASGSGKLVNTDNDWYTFFRANNNANAFGFSAHGKVVDTAGQAWHFNGLNRFVWDGEDFATLRVTEKFNLKPTGK